MNPESAGIADVAANECTTEGAPPPFSLSSRRRSASPTSPVIIHVPPNTAAALLSSGGGGGGAAAHCATEQQFIVNSSSVLPRPPLAPPAPATAGASTTTTATANAAVSSPLVGINHTDLPLFSLLSCATSCASSVTDAFGTMGTLSPMAALFHPPQPPPPLSQLGRKPGAASSDRTASPVVVDADGSSPTTVTNTSAFNNEAAQSATPNDAGVPAIGFHKEGLMFESDPTEFRRRAAENMRRRREDYARSQQQPAKPQFPLIPSPPRQNAGGAPSTGQRRSSSPSQPSSSPPQTSLSVLHAPSSSSPPSASGHQSDGMGATTAIGAAARDCAFAFAVHANHENSNTGHDGSSSSARGASVVAHRAVCGAAKSSSSSWSLPSSMARRNVTSAGGMSLKEEVPSPPLAYTSGHRLSQQSHEGGSSSHILSGSNVVAAAVSDTSAAAAGKTGGRSGRTPSSTATSVPFSRPRSSFASDAEFVEDALRTFCVDDRVVIDWNTRRWSYKASDKK